VVASLLQDIPTAETRTPFVRGDRKHYRRRTQWRS
jgi:hypothetical protein